MDKRQSKQVSELALDTARCQRHRFEHEEKDVAAVSGISRATAAYLEPIFKYFLSYERFILLFSSKKITKYYCNHTLTTTAWFAAYHKQVQLQQQRNGQLYL